MKLPLTDKFLWDLYNFMERLGDAYDIFVPRPWSEVCCPEFHKFRYEYSKKEERKKFSRFIYYLKKKGYIKIKNLENKQGVIFTSRGAEKLLKIKLQIKEKKKRPDGKWQMLIFDIPERKRVFRNLLRENLYILGYKMLQQSVWVCPYDVLKDTEIIIQRYSLDPYVRLFLIEEIDV